MPLLLLLAFSTQVHLTQREQRTFISSLRSSPRGGNGDVNTVPFQNKMSQWESREEVSLNHRFNPVCYRILTRKGSLQYRTDVTFPLDSSSCPTFSPKGNFKKMTAFRIAEDMVIKITAQEKKKKKAQESFFRSATGTFLTARTPKSYTDPLLWSVDLVQTGLHCLS